MSCSTYTKQGIKPPSKPRGSPMNEINATLNNHPTFVTAIEATSKKEAISLAGSVTDYLEKPSQT
eukprot:766705-Ditylum_brightwellii.AAC.1